MIRPLPDLSLLYVCLCVCVSSLKEIARRSWSHHFQIFLYSMCVHVSVCPVSKRWLGDYDHNFSRSFFTLCVSVCLCVWSKRDGYEIMIRPLLDLSLLYVCPCVCLSSPKEMANRLLSEYFQDLSLSHVCLCVLSKRDGHVIMIKPLLKYFFTHFFKSYFNASLGLSNSSFSIHRIAA